MMKKQCFVGLAITVALVLGMAGVSVADMIGGVDFPQGVQSFADQVVSFTPGPGTVSPHNVPSQSLGVPNYSNDSNYVSLGWGGTLVLKFTDNSLTTSGNNSKDLWIFEIGSAVEPTNVYLSKDASNWISVGYVGGATAGVDIDAFIGSGITLGDKYSYVKLVDQNKKLSNSPFAGADIDAVGAISSSSPVPVPPTVWLLGSGLIGLVGLRRRFRIFSK